MHDTELIALLERVALNAAVRSLPRYLLVAGTHRLAGSIGSHTDALTTADALTSYSGLLRDSATALQAAVVQPHSSRSTLTIRYAGCRSRTCCRQYNRRPSSKPAPCEATTTTDSERQAERWQEHDGEQAKALALRGRSTGSDVPQITT